MTRFRSRSWSALAVAVATLGAACSGTGTVDSLFTSSSSGSGASGGAGGSGAAGSGAASSSSSSSSSSGTGGQPFPSGCVTDVSAGHHVFPCAGIVYDVEIPPACASGGCGVVLDMHGFTMNAALEESGTKMRALGAQHGFVIVQPTAPGIPASWDQNAHTPLVFAFLGDTLAALAIDPKRVHAMGFSQGGGMTWRLVCTHASLFASVAPIGAIVGCEFAGPSVPSNELPMLVVHGRNDSVVNFAGIAIPQRDAALAFWGYGPGAVLENDGTHKATRFKTPSGTVLEFWEHDYLAGNFVLGGHCFPGGTDVGVSPFQFGCTAPGTFVYGALAMQFFLDHPKP